MKFIVLLMLLFPVLGEQNEGETLAVFWNLENFFDYFDDSVSESESEFSSLGARHWTKKRFQTKCEAIAKSIFYISDQKGRLPDIFAVAEVENKGVLRRLISNTLLRKTDYIPVHYDSDDPRGIDVALLYRKSSFSLVSDGIRRIPGIRTRDMLYCCFTARDGDSLSVIVCHHPSKYGGPESQPRREAAARELAALSDSLSQEGWSRQIALGDFNDTPDAPQFDALSGSFANLSSSLAEQGEGSIRFNGSWELIDLCFVSPSLAESAACEVLKIPFLLEKDAAHGGLKPLRTYLGPAYHGGVSDHCPVAVVLSP